MKKIKKINFSSPDNFDEIIGSKLSVGDFIVLKKNEVFPADVLLLDSENSYVLVETIMVDGKTEFNKKTPLKITSSFFFF